MLVGLDRGRVALADLRMSGDRAVLLVGGGGASGAAAGAQPSQPLHSLVVLPPQLLQELWQDATGMADEDGDSCQPGLLPEALVACTGVSSCVEP